MVPREQAYVGLGANVGETVDSLERAVRALGSLPGASITGVSSLYRTRPVGPIAQDEFLNAVVGLRVVGGPDAAAAAMALLGELKRLERTMGRRERVRWGPREIDLDLLLFGSHELHVERDATTRSDNPQRTGVQWLDVPHTAARERLFVLAPLADLAPNLRPPGWGMSVRVARDRALSAEGPEAVHLVGVWDATAQEWLQPGGAARAGDSR